MNANVQPVLHRTNKIRFELRQPSPAADAAIGSERLLSRYAQTKISFFMTSAIFSPVGQLAELPPYNGIKLADIFLITSERQADAALETLLQADVLGFDTESKPTFVKGEISQGPHLIQLATDEAAYLLPVGNKLTQQVAQIVMCSKQILKVGFGLSDDLKRLSGKMGIDAQNVLDLSFALRKGGRNDIGAKTAVAMFFGQRLQKSKKTSTTNWALPRLTERQMLYAADDAQVALRVYRAWRASGA